jgi:transcriptional regulator with XRE-family HTH domain
MRRQRRTTIIVVGGALAIASVGYGLGSQAGDGTAIADNTATEQEGSGPNRGAPPGLSALADKLGVGSAQLMNALRDYHDQNESSRRDEFAAKLAKALGVSTAKVQSAFEGLRADHDGRFGDRDPDRDRGGHEARFAAALAKALGKDTSEVKAALDKLRGSGPVGIDELASKLADELGVEQSDVRAALAKLRPPGPSGPGRPGPGGPGFGHHDRALPLRQLARKLGVSRADLRDAFRRLRADAQNDWKQEQEALAKFLADRFNLDLSKVQSALTSMPPPLRSPHPEGPRDNPAAL